MSDSSTDSRPVLVIGSSGMLGSSVVRDLERRGRSGLAPGRDRLDLLDTNLGTVLDELDPSAVINAAAFTDVQRAERAEHRALVFRINRDAPAHLARACRRLGIPLVHVSTDFVFDGAQREPYREEDPVGPLQVYGRSKLEGEQGVFRAHPEALVVRTSTLFGPVAPGRSHYVDSILRQSRQGGELGVVRPPVSSPTYVPDLARGIVDLLERRATGCVHLVNHGAASRLELARETVRLAGLANQVEIVERPVPQGDLERPAYSVLDTSRFSELTGDSPRPWREALREYLEPVSPG
jgi:dTDP-4-dehydrorhamnose reductase